MFIYFNFFFSKDAIFLPFRLKIFTLNIKSVDLKLVFFDGDLTLLSKYQLTFHLTLAENH